MTDQSRILADVFAPLDVAQHVATVAASSHLSGIAVDMNAAQRPPADPYTAGRHRRDMADDPTPHPDTHAADLAGAQEMSEELVEMVATLDRVVGSEVHGELTDAIRPLLYALRDHVVDTIDRTAEMVGVMSEVDDLIDSFEGR